jgi:hypothetical protein
MPMTILAMVFEMIELGLAGEDLPRLLPDIARQVSQADYQ